MDEQGKNFILPNLRLRGHKKAFKNLKTLIYVSALTNESYTFGKRTCTSREGTTVNIVLSIQEQVEYLFPPHPFSKTKK